MATSVGAVAASSVLPTAPLPVQPASTPGGTGASSSAEFAALPATYAGFGINGYGVGTIGIANNALAIVPVAPLAGTAAAAATGSSSGRTESSTTSPSTAKDPPPKDPPAADPPSVSIGQIATIGELSSVNERIAIANAQGDTGAAQQLLPYAVQLNAQLQYQPFAGLGITPAKPFASPEIPSVFLNIAA
jgi:hypothetical protein